MIRTTLICSCDHDGCDSEITVTVPVRLIERIPSSVRDRASGYACHSYYRAVFVPELDTFDKSLNDAGWSFEFTGATVRCPAHKKT